ncbi:MAG: hypothetical protein M3008_03495 [Chloroflexota bacterium]|nr:hypothetical protein [Chloroflexota bacterium]
MTRGKVTSVAVPIAAVLYVIVGIITGNNTVWEVGALIVAPRAMRRRGPTAHPMHGRQGPGHRRKKDAE